MNGGSNFTNVILFNIHDEIMEIKGIPEEEVKKSYNDIFDDETFLGNFVLHQLIIKLIELPLIHPRLIDWDQPSVAHIDEF